MEKLILNISVGATGLGLLFYLFAAVFSFRYLTGQSSKDEFLQKSWGVVLHGSLFLVLSSLSLMGFAYFTGGGLWDSILIVNLVDIFLSAAFLHTVYWKWNPKSSAWLAVSIVVLDAVLRFAIIFVKVS